MGGWWTLIYYMAIFFSNFQVLNRHWGNLNKLHCTCRVCGQDWKPNIQMCRKCVGLERGILKDLLLLFRMLVLVPKKLNTGCGTHFAPSLQQPFLVESTRYIWHLDLRCYTLELRQEQLCLMFLILLVQ